MVASGILLLLLLLEQLLFEVLYDLKLALGLRPRRVRDCLGLFVHQFFIILDRDHLVMCVHFVITIEIEYIIFISSCVSFHL